MDAKKVGNEAQVIWLPTPTSKCQISRIWHRKCQSGHPGRVFNRNRVACARIAVHCGRILTDHYSLQLGAIKSCHAAFTDSRLLRKQLLTGSAVLIWKNDITHRRPQEFFQTGARPQKLTKFTFFGAAKARTKNFAIFPAC